MKAVFEVEFNEKDMCDKITLKKEYKNSWLKCMKRLYKEEGLGIFEKDLKLVAIKKEVRK